VLHHDLDVYDRLVADFFVAVDSTVVNSCGISELAPLRACTTAGSNPQEYPFVGPGYRQGAKVMQ
jgi:hypothetical protein